MRPIAALALPVCALVLAACEPRSDGVDGRSMNVTVADAPEPAATPPAPAANAVAPAAGDQGLDAVVDSALANAANSAPAAQPDEPEPPPAQPAPAPAQPKAPPSGPYSGTFRLVGAEPFWNATLGGGSLLLQRMDRPDLTATTTGPRMTGGWAVWTGRWQQSTITIRLRRGDCSDGMSDQVHSYDAEVTLWGTTLRGCANRR